jgi:cytidyltransferase-like protein
MSFREKIIPWDKLPRWRAALRSAGKKLVVTNGCFDVLHVGHVRYLEGASREADCLVVAVNDDGSVRALKGAGRPILAAADRAELVAALRAVDYVVLFPVPQEGPATLQLELVARSCGQEVKQTIPLKVKPRKWRHDQLKLSDAFLGKMAASLPVSKPGDLLGNFLEINRETRRQNHERVRQVCFRSSPQPLWSGPFQRFLGKTEAGFGDRRTYVYRNKTVDQQVHLGVDLASLVNSQVPAANRGVVVLAEPLGIYGQTVIIDHGLGVFSMYSHLSQIAVKVGDQV